MLIEKAPSRIAESAMGVPKWLKLVAIRILVAVLMLSGLSGHAFAESDNVGSPCEPLDTIVVDSDITSAIIKAQKDASAGVPKPAIEKLEKLFRRSRYAKEKIVVALTWGSIANANALPEAALEAAGRGLEQSELTQSMRFGFWKIQALALFYLGRDAEHIELLESPDLLACRPWPEDMRARLATSYYATGHVDKAKAMVEQAFDGIPNPDTDWHELAIALACSGKATQECATAIVAAAKGRRMQGDLINRSNKILGIIGTLPCCAEIVGEGRERGLIDQDLRLTELASPAETVREMVPIIRVAPDYPRSALNRGIEGYVILQIEVAPDGTVSSAKIVKSQPEGVFDSAALTAAKKSVFKPRVKDGIPVATTGAYTIRFMIQK